MEDEVVGCAEDPGAVDVEPAGDGSGLIIGVPFSSTAPLLTPGVVLIATILFPPRLAPSGSTKPATTTPTNPRLNTIRLMRTNNFTFMILKTLLYVFYAYLILFS